MTAVLLHVFLFSTWGLGLLSWLAALSNSLANWDLDRQGKMLDMHQKKLIFGKFNSLTGDKTISLTNSVLTASNEEIPEKIKELMKSSPNHPEVEEIDGTDQILGVRFEAENYPPGFADEEE